MRTLTIVLAALLVAAAAAFAAPAGHAGATGIPTCFGTPATDWLTSAGTLVGTNGDDVLVGSSGSDVIKGISHQALADYLGTYRETVSAILRDFKRQGLVELGYRRISLLDVDELQAVAGIWDY